MKRLKLQIAYLYLLLVLVCQSSNLYASVHDEGRSLLKFRKRIAFDPYGAMSNWSEESDSHCSWFGVKCNNHGRVVSLDLKNLLLEGTLAPDLGSLCHLKSLILHNNSFSGTIPKEIGELQKLKVLDFGYNNFSGPFPSEISNNLSLQIIVLRSNPQMGSIQPNEVQPSSDQFDIRRKSKSASSRRFLKEANSVPRSQNASSSNGHNSNLIIILSVAIGVCFILLVVGIYFICSRANKVVTVMPWRTGLSGQLQKAFVTGVPSLKRAELESACEDFSNVVGSLSDCFLYKGTLSSGIEIAVTSSMITSAKDWSDHHESQFRNKISMLSKVNHKNFMNLIGYCEEEEPFTRMMVYEYAPNGTLFEHLHIKEADHLDWPARLRIIMGVAYCIDHMHQLDPPSILNNLTSSSIYLCDDYAAKISDLPFVNGEKEIDGELSFESSRVLDTKFSTLEGNVYKFGIIVLEIVSGRLPFSEDDGLLVLWASSHLMGKRPLMNMVDSTLESFGEEDVIALSEIIKMCIHKDPKRRPTMSEVVTKLRKITNMPPNAASPKLSALWWAELEIISTEMNSIE